MRTIDEAEKAKFLNFLRQSLKPKDTLIYCEVENTSYQVKIRDILGLMLIYDVSNTIINTGAVREDGVFSARLDFKKSESAYTIVVNDDLVFHLSKDEYASVLLALNLFKTSKFENFSGENKWIQNTKNIS